MRNGRIFRDFHAFQMQKRPLCRKTPRKTAKTPRGDDAVAGQKDGKRVFADRICRGAHRTRMSARGGKLPVGDDTSVGDQSQRRPDVFPEGRALRRKGHGKAFPFFRKVFRKLRGGERRNVIRRFRPALLRRNHFSERRSVRAQQKQAERRFDKLRKHLLTVQEAQRLDAEHHHERDGDARQHDAEQDRAGEG